MSNRSKANKYLPIERRLFTNSRPLIAYDGLMIDQAPNALALKKPSLFWRVTSWLWPTNRDSLYWLCCTLVMLGLLDPIVEQQTLLAGGNSCGTLFISLGFIAGAIVGIATTWGWNKLNFRSAKILIASVLVGCVALAYSTYLTYGTSVQVTTPMLFGGAQRELVPIFVGKNWPLAWGLFFGGVSLLSVLLFGLIRFVRFGLSKFRVRPSFGKLTLSLIHI